MSRVKIFGVDQHLNPIKAELSATIHSCLVDALSLPPEKRFHRFFPLDPENFIFPPDRSPRYMIIEISMFAGRSLETQSELLRLLFARLEARHGIAPNDVEITITETLMANWGIRGGGGTSCHCRTRSRPNRAEHASRRLALRLTLLPRSCRCHGEETAP